MHHVGGDPGSARSEDPETTPRGAHLANAQAVASPTSRHRRPWTLCSGSDVRMCCARIGQAFELGERVVLPESHEQQQQQVLKRDSAVPVTVSVSHSIDIHVIVITFLTIRQYQVGLTVPDARHHPPLNTGKGTP